mmetsp:Transcript_140448/g.261836  ORF Transcript_140448/g.261836 Transcript_140448/m.261836 type:complete len:436 (+) Transcript_140448:58-1365(+)
MSNNASIEKESENVSPMGVVRALAKGQYPALRSLYVMAVLEVAGFSMLIPVAPYFAIKELGLQPREFGLVMSAHAVAQLIGASIGGRVSDCVGRYPVLLACFAWSTLGMGGMFFVNSFSDLLILRTLLGLSGGTIPVCHAYILDAVPSGDRAVWMGFFGCATGVSFVGGCALGSFLVFEDISRRHIFVLAATYAFLATIWGVFFLQESLPDSKRRPLLNGKEAWFTSCDVVGGGLMSVWLVRLLISVAQGLLFATYAFLIADLFGWSDFEFGIALAVTGVLGATLQLTMYPVLAQQSKLGAVWSLGIGCACGMVALCLYPRRKLVLHIFAASLFTAGGALVEPAIPTLIGYFAGERHLGFANGMSGSARSIASAFAPLLGGFLYQRNKAYPYYLGSILFACSALFASSLVQAPELAEKPGEAERLLYGLTGVRRV